MHTQRQTPDTHTDTKAHAEIYEHPDTHTSPTTQHRPTVKHRQTAQAQKDEDTYKHTCKPHLYRFTPTSHISEYTHTDTQDTRIHTHTQGVQTVRKKTGSSDQPSPTPVPGDLRNPENKESPDQELRASAQQALLKGPKASAWEKCSSPDKNFSL